MVVPTGAVVRAGDTWRPRSRQDPAEARLEKFGPWALPDAIDWRGVRTWWLAHSRGANTPNWDVAASCSVGGRPGIILMEAKANRRELNPGGKSWFAGRSADAAWAQTERPSLRSRENHARIGAAISEARDALRPRFPELAISRDTHYQLSNRVAFAWRLASLGLPTVLVYLGFTGDEGIRDVGEPFADAGAWADVFAEYAGGFSPPPCESAPSTAGRLRSGCWCARARYSKRPPRGTDAWLPRRSGTRVERRATRRLVRGATYLWFVVIRLHPREHADELPIHMTIDLKLQDRARGALLGLATGDALGTALEFQPPGTFTPITDLVGGGPFGLAPGQWTDDTSMALCLAESLLERQGFDARDQMERYLRWYRHGHHSSTEECFDIGNTVRAALGRFERTGEPFSGSPDPRAAGNGSLMRLAPVPIAFLGDPRQAIARAADSSRTTHAAVAAVDACRYFAGLLVGALRGTDKDALLSARYSPVPGLWDAEPLVAEVDDVALGSFTRREPPTIRGTGYVVQSLEAALWAFRRSASFRDGCLLAANLGDDADTTAAVYGQLAGAFYGASGIPEDWMARLAGREMIAAMADGLLALAAGPG